MLIVLLIAHYTQFKFPLTFHSFLFALKIQNKKRIRIILTKLNEPIYFPASYQQEYTVKIPTTFAIHRKQIISDLAK